MDFPLMHQVWQRRRVPSVEDVEKQIRQELARLNLKRRVRKDAEIAITGTSRGLFQGPVIYRTLVEELKELGAKPFVVPAMGSHGGATVEGQIQILSALGITADALGAPIKATMETVQVGTTRTGFPVYADRYAASANKVVVINRIKPHTNFQAPLESGLLKMMAVGLGKADGAKAVHHYAAVYGYYRVILEVAKTMMEKVPILFGLATVENLYHQVATIRALLPDVIINEERKLLAQARKLIGRLPFRAIDLLIVDEMGKEISGAGLDTNVIGRLEAKKGLTPDIKRIYVRDLTETSHGNAVGVGHADFISKKLMRKIDIEATRINALSANTPEQARLPLAFDTDAEAITAALETLGAARARAKVVWIKNTLELASFKISQSLLPEARKTPHLEIAKEGKPLALDQGGTLLNQV